MASPRPVARRRQRCASRAAAWPEILTRICRNELHRGALDRIKPHSPATPQAGWSRRFNRSEALGQGFETVGRVGLEPTTGGL
jgi:hypothetical protein